MQKSLLFSHKYKKIGWGMLVFTLPLGLWVIWKDFEFQWLSSKVYNLFPSSIFKNYGHIVSVNLTNTLIGVLFIVGALLVGFSKEKIEDEYIATIRLNALLWAVFINYTLLIICFLLIYDMSFLHVMIYNMFTVLLLFIFRFHYLLFKR